MRACAAATLSSWHASTTTRLVRSFLLCSNTTGRCESKPEEGGEVGDMCVSATKRGLLIALTAGRLMVEASNNLVGGLIRLGLTMHQIVMILPLMCLYVSSYSSHCGYKTPHTYSLSPNKHMCSGNCELSVIGKNSLFTLAKRLQFPDVSAAFGCFHH